MALANLSVGFSVTGKIASSFASMAKTVNNDLTKIKVGFGSLSKQKLDGKKTFGTISRNADKSKTSLVRLGGSIKKTGNDLVTAARKGRQFNQALVRLRSMQRIDIKLGNVKQQLSAAKTSALGVLATGYALKRVYLSAATVLQAQGDIATLGITERGIQSISKAGEEMSLKFGQISAPQFIKASYSIKSAISSLSEDGVKDFTRMAGVTAVATKSSIGEMTKLYAMGYGVFRKDFSSDVKFGKAFSGAIAFAVQAFNTDGSDLAGGLNSIGASAKSMGVTLAEQLAIIGVAKDAIGSASEAGTKYKSFIDGAGKAQEKLGLSFTDTAGNMLPMVEILELIKAKYGSFDLADNTELKEAFGSSEATGLIAVLIDKTDKLTDSQIQLNQAMQGGLSKAEEMAAAADRGQGFEKLGNSFAYIGYTLGKVLEPAVNWLASAVGELAKGIAWLDRTFPILVPAIVGVASGLGTLFMIVKTVKLAKLGLRLANLTLSKSLLGTAASSNIAGGSMKRGGLIAKASAAGHYVLNGALTASKFMLRGMGKLFSLASLKTIAFSAASKVAAAGQWLLNAALSANPIGLLIIGVAALAAGAVWLYKNFEPFTNLVNTVWDAFKSMFSYIADKWQVVSELFSSVAGFFGFGSDDDENTTQTTKHNKPKLATAIGTGVLAAQLATAAPIPKDTSITIPAPSIAATPQQPRRGLPGYPPALGNTRTIPAAPVASGVQQPAHSIPSYPPAPGNTRTILATPVASGVQQPAHSIPSYPPAPGNTRTTGAVTQHNTVYVTVNNPSSNVDIERAVVTAMRQHSQRRGTSLTDEVV